MSSPCFLSSAARSISLPFPAAGLLRCRLLSSCSVTRNMSSKSQMDHLEKTASNYRQNALYPAQVCGIINESQTVKRLRLAVHPDFSFKAGQWWEVSPCAPARVCCRGRALLNWPSNTPNTPQHTGSTPRPSVDLLLVAGGVGINPLYSILLHSTDLLRLNHASGGREHNISAHLCYSAKNTQELLFKSSIIEACREFPDKLSCDLHVTQQSTAVDSHLQPFINHGRITDKELRAHVDPQRTLCFLCGPPPMIEALSKTLMDFGLPKDRILFEKWW
ncbi:hypothetical protein FQN60_007582 [Etheostoma spectabile]|uniref:Oxidoreductase FAD/NAD(P)-binding domain-containing protein n=1 Tax=Etheostoma spectabile TaxID=54343 RepID=A0A5J5CYL6_9PERO|nr:hypothetical protein FQN60_007582 [Etheostoma spectabile]